MSSNINPKDVREALKALIDNYEELERRWAWVKSHILQHVSDFTAEELQCLAMDGAIEYSQIPESKRTEHAQFMARDRGGLKPIGERDPQQREIDRINALVARKAVLSEAIERTNPLAVRDRLKSDTDKILYMEIMVERRDKSKTSTDDRLKAIGIEF